MTSGACLRLDLGDRTQLIAFLLRDYGPATTLYIESRLSHGGVFFDVGGHVGMITFTFTVAALRPDATIHAFQPNTENAAGWRHNHKINPGARACLIEKGLSDRGGELRFTVPTDSISGMFDEQGEYTLPVVTLDTYCAENAIGHIDVLKVDVQGHEPAVLRGARRMLGEGRVDPAICEICDPLLRMAGANQDDIKAPLNAAGLGVLRVPEAGLRRKLPVPAGFQEDLAFGRSRGRG